MVAEILERTAKDAEKFKPIHVKKHLELEYDVGSLLAVDINDLDAKLINKEKNDYIKNLTRDNIQLLINQIWQLPTERVDDAVVVKLPNAKTLLPRSLPVPKEKTLTKWESFAKEKGIRKSNKAKVHWDEELKEWIPEYGYKRAAAEREKDWVIEVPGNADPYEDQFAKKKQAKVERVAKNEFQRLRNIAKAKNIKIPKMGVVNPDMANSKDLVTAITVAKSSTASVGKFQSSLPKEKEARGVADITPGAKRKRKMPVVPSMQERSENLAIIDSVLNKKPKLDVSKALSKHLYKEQEMLHEEPSSKKPRAGKRGKKKGGNPVAAPKGGKKPKSGKGVHKASGNVGRKRR